MPRFGTVRGNRCDLQPAGLQCTCVSRPTRLSRRAGSGTGPGFRGVGRGDDPPRRTAFNNANGFGGDVGRELPQRSLADAQPLRVGCALALDGLDSIGEELDRVLAVTLETDRRLPPRLGDAELGDGPHSHDVDENYGKAEPTRHFLRGEEPSK